MNAGILLGLNHGTYSDVLAHLLTCDASFAPRLSERVTVASYARKIVDNATRIEAWLGMELVGLVAVYGLTPPGDAAFITNVSVLPPWQGKKIASGLIAETIAHVTDAGIKLIKLQVHHHNLVALRLYQAFGFKTDTNETDQTTMTLHLN
jgi:ribosomal protein S18 acetylase RimI-like enzyme